MFLKHLVGVGGTCSEAAGRQDRIGCVATETGTPQVKGPLNKARECGRITSARTRVGTQGGT